MSDKNLEIWQLAKWLIIDIHKMTLSELPKFELGELLTRYQWPETSNIITLTILMCCIIMSCLGECHGEIRMVDLILYFTDPSVSVS